MSFSWLPTELMVADVLTKEKNDMRILDKILRENKYKRVVSEVNKVVNI